MQDPTNSSQTAPANLLVAAPLPNTLWFEDVAPEESVIRELEKQIGEARRNGTPVDTLIESRNRTYRSWLERLDQQESDPKTAEWERQKIRRQRERAKRDYEVTE